MVVGFDQERSNNFRISMSCLVKSSGHKSQDSRKHSNPFPDEYPFHSMNFPLNDSSDFDSVSPLKSSLIHRTSHLNASCLSPLFWNAPQYEHEPFSTFGDPNDSQYWDIFTVFKKGPILVSLWYRTMEEQADHWSSLREVEFGIYYHLLALVIDPATFWVICWSVLKIHPIHWVYWIIVQSSVLKRCYYLETNIG